MWGQKQQALPGEEVGWAAATWLERARYRITVQAESTVWCPALWVGYTCSFATPCMIFLLVPGVTSKTAEVAQMQGKHLTILKGLGDDPYLQI